MHDLTDHFYAFHVVLTLGQGVLAAFSAYLVYRSHEAAKDRELKYRQIEMQLNHNQRLLEEGRE